MQNDRKETVQVHEGTDNVGRIALLGLILVITLLLASVRVVFGQAPSNESRGAIRPFVGAYIPTGEQRDFLKDAVLVGAQGTWNTTEMVALTGSFGWAPSKDKVTAGDLTLDAFQYDLGVEVHPSSAILAGTTPFVGLGAGGRTYSYRDYSVDSKTNFDGYAALGLDALAGPVGLRLEARDYVSKFQPLAGGGESKTRNDLAIFAGVGIRF
ncbi:MAG TPA: hypothetical protein VFT29_04630 [Gemmatimonadaceae bacterium]|nr:hypothetical protein [Gemmatimonadaceae bacterium]